MQQVIMGRNTRQGFTLVELLIVIAIIGILAAVLTPQFLNARRVAADRVAETFVHEMATALEVFYLTNDGYPLANDLAALGVHRPEGLKAGMGYINAGSGERGAFLCAPHQSGSGKWFVYYPGYGSVVFPKGNMSASDVPGLVNPGLSSNDWKKHIEIVFLENNIG